jgi:hypothetical protein
MRFPLFPLRCLAPPVMEKGVIFSSIGGRAASAAIRLPAPHPIDDPMAHAHLRRPSGHIPAEWVWLAACGQVADSDGGAKTNDHRVLPEHRNAARAQDKKNCSEGPIAVARARSIAYLAPA